MRNFIRCFRKTWLTNIDISSKLSALNLPAEIKIRKSRIKYLFTSIIAIVGLTIIMYTIIDKAGFNFATTLFLFLFSIFSFFSIKGLFDRAIQIKMDPISITFIDGSTFKWEEIQNTFIDRRFYNSSRGIGIERHYLNIEPVFSGLVTKYRVTKSFEVTGLEYSPREISHFIELFKQQAKR